MSPRLPSLVFVCVLLAATASAGFIDLFTWNLGSSLVPEGADTKRQGDDDLSPVSKRNCSCEGNSCNCCVDFNLSFIDLGGPGCVRMKYLSPAEGILVNVSYGDSDLHSETVKGANPEPTCMNILTDLAQVCARFSDLAPTSDGLRWCLQLEPTLLGDVQTQYQVGCFRLGPLGMTVDPPIEKNATYASPVVTNSTAKPGEGEGEGEAEETTDSSEAALIAAVNESAEEGIAFFSNLLGINFGGAELSPNKTDTDTETQVSVSLPVQLSTDAASPSTTPTTTSTTTTTTTPTPTTAAEQRAARSRFQVPGTSVNRLL